MSDKKNPEITVETHHQIIVKCKICGSWTHNRVFLNKVYQFGLCDMHNSAGTVEQQVKSLIQE